MRDPATLRVHIYEDCDVDFESANVSKSLKDQIEWQSTGDAFTIEFDSSPFERGRIFEVPAGGCISSGPVREDAAYATYHYVIRSRGGGQLATDPDVNIKP